MVISFTCLHSDVKSIQNLFFFFHGRTHDCPIPAEQCLNCVIHCLKWDRAFNYSLIIFADVELSGALVGWWAAVASGFPAAFSESELVCNAIGFAGYSFPGPIN